MVDSGATVRMSGMDNDDKCSGSLKLIATADRPATIGSWTGECPQCGTRVEFGYAGRVPVHEPPRNGGRPDERLRHVQVRVPDVVHDHDTRTPALGHPREPAVRTSSQGPASVSTGGHPP
jgi:hypothetical protein